jgi:hypothetical protein
LPGRLASGSDPDLALHLMGDHGGGFFDLLCPSRQEGNSPMPLTSLKLDLFSENLPREPAGEQADPDRVWWVIRTRPRAEKNIARRPLRAARVFLLPLPRRRWDRQEWRFRWQPPLFPEYLPCMATAECISGGLRRTRAPWGSRSGIRSAVARPRVCRSTARWWCASGTPRTIRATGQAPPCPFGRGPAAVRSGSRLASPEG